MSAKRPRVAFVVQRAGREVNGGAELLCLSVARRMAEFWDVDILTTRALDYMTWQDHYPAGIEMIDGVTVHRFSVDEPRNVASFNRFSETVARAPAETSVEDAKAWMHMQGPASSALSAHIEESREDYDAFIFYTYLYATTFENLHRVADKAYLAPFAHDEWPIYLPIWDDFFTLPRQIVFSTLAEKRFLEQRFPNALLPGDIVALGIDEPADTSAERFRQKTGITEPFMIYVGRVDESKGCGELFDLYARYRETHPYPLSLVLAGNPVMDIPELPGIHSLGFVDDETKYDAIAASSLLVNPSPHESLSMVLLEAWLLGVPTLVSERCDVTKHQSIRSDSGLWYANAEEFSACVDCLVAHPEIAKNGPDFVRKHYAWDAVVAKYRAITGL